MKLIRRTSQFKKDVKRMKKRGKEMNKLKGVLQTLASGEELAP